MSRVGKDDLEIGSDGPVVLQYGMLIADEQPEPAGGVALHPLLH